MKIVLVVLVVLLVGLLLYKRLGKCACTAKEKDAKKEA